MKNKWKVAFFLLFGINLIGLIIILSMVLTPPKNNILNQDKEPLNDYVSFHIKSNKKDVNQLINHYLHDEASGSPIDYQVILGDEVELYGALPIFSDLFHLKITFEPEALKNGDLILKQKTMTIGRLNLSVSFVLNFIHDNYQLPRGVEILPNNQLIYIHMQQLKLKSNIKIKADQFNLKTDDIAFTLLVPVK
ncbi:YpmS family protein [Neobacillus fumarioli]|uniref:YpmS family protein n=1 Tax=Neobacillus fumarioli TaxID=105229 RepID=UPI00082CB89C|nr:YpmS family protein [Neobacillus fumarioli]